MALERRIFVLLDLMREVIISKSMIQNFVNIFLCHERELPDKVLRFSIHKTQRILDAWDPFYGRTLTIFDSMQGHQLSRFKRLKVLRLMACQVNHFSDDIVNLFHLRYSSLWRTKIEVIPNSIEKLKCSQTFDIKSTREKADRNWCI